MSSILPTLRRAMAGAVVALLFLSVLELMLWALDLPDAGLYQGDPARVWWLRPGLDRQVPFPEEHSSFRVVTNPAGLRGPLPPADRPWTLALGCSTTFGWGVDGEQAWPAVLSQRLGEPVINGGVPGWSTHQAVLGADRYLELRPHRVILAYLVRDAQAAPFPDSASRGTPWPLTTHLARSLTFLRLQLRQRAGMGSPPSWVRAIDPDRARVSPAAFAHNLRKLIRKAAPAEAILLAFPQREPSLAWIEAMRQVAPTLEPHLPEDAFYPHDRIHLTPAGHRLLAEWLAAALKKREADVRNLAGESEGSFR